MNHFPTRHKGFILKPIQQSFAPWQGSPVPSFGVVGLGAAAAAAGAGTGLCQGVRARTPPGESVLAQRGGDKPEDVDRALPALPQYLELLCPPSGSGTLHSRGPTLLTQTKAMPLL